VDCKSDHTTFGANCFWPYNGYTPPITSRTPWMRRDGMYGLLHGLLNGFIFLIASLEVHIADVVQVVSSGSYISTSIAPPDELPRLYLQIKAQERRYTMYKTHHDRYSIP
jgi:hypothetical protein